MPINNIHLTGYALDLIPTGSYDDFVASIAQLKEFLALVPKYNSINTPSDYLSYQIDPNYTFDELLLEIADKTGADFNFLLSETERAFGEYLSWKYTSDTIISQAENINPQNPVFICFYSQKHNIPRVPSNLLINTVNDLYKLNCSNLSIYPIDVPSFCKRSKLIFHNIAFHSAFQSTLSTMKMGDIHSYSSQFVIAMQALHNSFHKLSKVGNNKNDLITISAETENLGRRMDCTPEGANKAEKNLRGKFVFNGKEIEINCEYHLKINHTNDGKLLEREYYNRAYFGLHLIDSIKYIGLYHLGCHL